MKYFLKSFAVILLVALFAVSCGGKKEKPKEKQKQEKVDLQKLKKERAKEQAKITEQKYQDITGTWVGKFDKRSAVLKITEQNKTSFKGKIQINYRQQINQKVAGSFNAKNKSFQMKDLLHSRYAGTYAGKFSDDYSSMSGKFTMNVGKKKFQFTFKKKK